MSWAIWVTGPPASGKSTLVRLAAARLADKGIDVTVLELDRLRVVLTPRPSYDEAEHALVHRALVFMAVALTAAGRPVLIDATGHRREWRDLARASLGRFAEVQLDCPLDLCVAREQTCPCGRAPSAVYDVAERPAGTVPRLEVAYERALAPELAIDTAVVGPEVATEWIVALALGLDADAPPLPAGGRGAVIWLTGLPGSGKTTLASRLAQALDAESVPTTILEWLALRATVLGGPCPSAAEVDLAHRALAVTAAQVAEAGVLVIVDAVAPRRAWRNLARALVDSFGEVQLVCPPETCAERERAVRWRPRRCPQGGVVVDVEWPTDYEYAANPELIIDTAARGEWTATEDLLVLARRLLAGRPTPPQKESPMRVRDLMSTKPITVEPGMPMLEARQRMVEERIRHLIVTEGSRIAGIVTDRDIRLNLPSPATSLSVWEVNYLLARLTVGDVMTRSVLVVAPDRSAAEAARLMMEHKISALPVTDGDRLLGIVTETDFVRAIARLEGTA